jgi:hypothetical protein
LPEFRQLLPRLFETSVRCLHPISGYRELRTGGVT